MIEEKKIEIGTDFGTIAINLKDIMDEKKISINTMSRLTNVKYDIVKKYYYGDNYNFNNDILAKFCYILDCEISDIIRYIPFKTSSSKGSK